MNLILGVIVNVADEAREEIKKTLDEEKQLAEIEEGNHLVSMCASMDTDNSGELTQEELMAEFKLGGDFTRCLTDMDIKEEDLDVLWTILDSDRSGTVSVEEFVTQVYRMKSSDTNFMLAYIKYYVTDIRHRLSDDMVQLKRDLETRMQMQEKEEKDMAAEIVKVENG